MTAELEQCRWSTEGFLHAWEAGAFDDARVEMVDGFAVYWAVGREAVHVHTGPSSVGYQTVQRYGPGNTLPVPYAEAELDVTELLGAAS